VLFDWNPLFFHEDRLQYKVFELIYIDPPIPGQPERGSRIMIYCPERLQYRNKIPTRCCYKLRLFRGTASKCWYSNLIPRGKIIAIRKMLVNVSRYTYLQGSLVANAMWITRNDSLIMTHRFQYHF